MTDSATLTSQYLPGFENHVVVTRRMAADIETPVSAFYKLREAGAVFLLESVEHGAHFGRYSFIGMESRARVRIHPGGLTITRNGGPVDASSHSDYVAIEPAGALRALFSGGRIRGSHDIPPLLGGVVGYIGYDINRYFEPKAAARSLPDDAILAELFLVDTLVSFDHVRHEIVVMSLAEDSRTAEPSLEKIQQALSAPLSITPTHKPSGDGRSEESNFTKAQFCQAVERAKEHIACGDIFQVVLSQRLTGETSAEPFSVYRALRMLNPSPYMYYLDFGERKIIGSSPEALVKLSGRHASVRPIAGTRPRGTEPAEDRRLADDLLADDKERAEHVMLVDLGRNDLGRCCEYGTVTVEEYMEVERFSHVMHLCSTVTGKLREDIGPYELFRSAFPAGTVSGAPKIRAMQIIDDIEPDARGMYSGAVGYVSASGEMDWCIGIRTILMEGNSYHLQAGAGIVADSIPEKEYEETLHKLAALRAAITTAESAL